MGKYPSRFRDMIGDEVVGTGYDSLLNPLANKVDNLSRTEIHSSLKRKVAQKIQGKIKLMDSHGCRRCQPESLPVEKIKKACNVTIRNSNLHYFFSYLDWLRSFSHETRHSITRLNNGFSSLSSYCHFITCSTAYNTIFLV